MTFDEQMDLYRKVSCLDGEEIAQAFKDFLGLQVFNDEFKDFLISEGYLYDEDSDDEDSDDEL